MAAEQALMDHTLYLFRSLFSKDMDPWGLGLVRVGEMRLLQQ